MTTARRRAIVTDMDAVFNTLAYARRLREAGVDDARAEAHAEALHAAFHEGVATRADLARVEAKVNVLQWVIGLNALLSLAMAARLFGAI